MRRLKQSHRILSFQVLYSLLNQSENMSGWPSVVSEDIVKQVHKLKNEMFVMSGKIKGRPCCPSREHLGSLDGTLESMERSGPCRGAGGGVVPRNPQGKLPTNWPWCVQEGRTVPLGAESGDGRWSPQTH